MKILDYDVVIIGGGPAGLGAAAKAKEEGARVAVIERNNELGGILNQCIHSGFGLQYFKEELTGPEYAELFINKVRAAGIDCYLKTMVLDITDNKKVTAINEEGTVVFEAGSIILAMGCRERTRGAIKIPGARPAGVFTAGLAQRYVNMENLKPGSKVAILGSGDIGLIMARRLTLEGIEVVGVYELMSYPNGLYRNIKNCLDDFDIPLYLSTTVTKINGSDRLESIEVTKVDEDLCPIAGTEATIDCDTLLLSIGLIPENELSKKAGVVLNPITNGPVVDDDLETSVAGIFACGNVLHVHDLVDNVTLEAEEAGIKAAHFAKEQKQSKGESIVVKPEGLVRYTVPSTINKGKNELVTLKFRTGRPVDNAKAVITSGNQIIFESKKARTFIPSIMEEINVKAESLRDITEPLVVAVKEV